MSLMLASWWLHLLNVCMAAWSLNSVLVRRCVQQRVGHTTQDKKLRIYSRNGDPAYTTAVNEAFERWTQKHFSGQVKPCSPFKGLQPKKRKLSLDSSDSRVLSYPTQ